ncbi:NADPH-dependent F420 reductase [Actinomadura opuntiae]|uniref:NADPH-dependent F420 reductase n=1 Tax=Actinomadura sp. OS1-43 TaxID=604315 RepID=UPI00255B1312|nr:NAD(P)-binding domain-containing protein [Actinomadura sp. OS1-43]MDL4814478.1 NAD(P)-binding domain-containing protein [Actinomadura sp. OS1-43]
MKIGVLGAGAMTEALAAGWVRAGHDVLIGGRTPAKAEALAGRVGARSGTLRDAAEFGDAVLVAVRREGLADTIAAAGGALAGKPVIDCGNAVDTADFSQVTYRDGASMAEEIARLAPGAHVVKAFNQAHASVWAMTPPAFDGRPLAVPFAGDEEAKPAARTLITALGAEPLDAGDLRQARNLEAMAIVVIRLLFSGHDPHSVFAFTTPNRPTTR